MVASTRGVPVARAKSSRPSRAAGEEKSMTASASPLNWAGAVSYTHLLETTEGCQIKYLEPGQAPEVKFALAPGDRVKAAYAYCNLHGLWRA